MEALTDQVQLSFHDLVMNGGWLSNDTKKLAETKIRAIIHNIGYPDYILDDKLLQDEFFGVRKFITSH
jgi:predicted metalloendopeptidase